MPKCMIFKWLCSLLYTVRFQHRFAVLGTRSFQLQIDVSRPLVAIADSTHFVDSHLFPCFLSDALRISAKKGFLAEGRQLHTHLVKLGYSNVLSLQNQLLHVYVKCKVFRDACNLFDELLVRNVVTWNTLICGAADCSWSFRSNLYLGFYYFKRMTSEMVSPDCITFTSLLRACNGLSDIEIGRQVHCSAMKLGLCQDCFVSSGLVDLYAKFGLVGDARRVFDNILRRDLVLWNVMVSCYALNCLVREAFDLFSSMQLEGVKGDDFTFTNLLNASASLRSCESGRQIHGNVIRLSFDWDVVVASALIDMYAKNGNLVDARKTFDGMVFRNVVSWTTMIVAYGQYGDGNEAITLLREMCRGDFGPDELTLASVLSSCGNSSSYTEIVQIHAYIIKIGFQAILSIENSLINSYSKCGCITMAFKSFSSMMDPDIVSWTSMIRAYAFHGLPMEGIELFERMLSNGVHPDGVAFLSVLSACCHGGLVFEGLHYFNLMTGNYHVEPYLEHYTCLVDLLGRAGLLDEAFNVLTSMPIEPGSDILGAFIGACKVHGYFGFAKWAAERLFVMEPSKPVNYSLMSNVYASVNCWLDVAKVRKMMRDRCKYKVPGCSWVEIGGEVHTFVSNDKSYSRASDLHAMLKLLVRSMEEEDCVCVDFTFDHG